MAILPIGAALAFGWTWGAPLPIASADLAILSAEVVRIDRVDADSQRVRMPKPPDITRLDRSDIQSSAGGGSRR
jgi:hypothetical protein